MEGLEVGTGWGPRELAVGREVSAPLTPSGGEEFSPQPNTASALTHIKALPWCPPTTPLPT